MTTSLHSYGGAAAPDGLADDLAQLAKLPAEARARFWEVLGPTLGADPIPREVERKIDVFCAEHAAPPDAVARALRAARSLVRGAARYGLGRGGFADDLSRLACDDETVSLLVGGFELAALALRKQAAIREIGAHGSLLTGVDWRVDRILDTKRVKALGVDVLMLTLTYKEGGQERTITLQVLPDMLAELRRVGVTD